MRYKDNVNISSTCQKHHRASAQVLRALLILNSSSSRNALGLQRGVATIRTPSHVNRAYDEDR
jgi:hypothetical protein